MFSWGAFASAGASLVVIPFVSKLIAAATTTYGAVQLTHVPTRFNGVQQPNDQYIFSSYRENFIIDGNDAALAGTYMHGFQLINETGTPITFSTFVATGAIRQQTDQSQKKYADFRR